MADNTWTPIDDLTAFQDDAVFEIDQKTKGIQVLVEQPIVSGENKSQFIKFQMGRYYDAIDLTDMEVNILYESPTGYQDISSAVNREYSDEYIRFGWLVPYAACSEKGKLSFAVEFVGADYTLKTTKSTTEVLDSIAGSSAVPEPVEQTWYIELQSQIAAAIDSANSTLESVSELIETFQGDIGEAISDWLTSHPEATTTIADGEVITAKLADGAVTEAKLEQSLKQKIFTPYLFVPYLDAEQTLSGHCFAFVYKNHCTLIDLGPYVSFDTLKAQLINRGIDTVDNIIITHWHYDHDGFMEGYSGNIANAYNHWKNAFDMTNTVFYIPRDTPTGFDGSGGYNAIMASFASNTKNILSNSTVFEWKDVVFSVKNQGDDDYAYYSTLGSSDLNYCSAIVYAEYKDVVFLDSGDILATSQERCVNEGYVKHADIVSIPHHGVSGAGYAGFMETVKPLYAYVPNSFYGTQYGLQDPNIGIASFTATIFENVNNNDGVTFDLANGACVSGAPSITVGRAISGKRIIYVDESVALTDYQDGTEQHPFQSITTACGHLKDVTEINLLSDIATTAYISGAQGVVIISGNGHQIGGVNIGNGAHVQINNVKTKSDYGIYINDSYVKMESCTITTPCSISRSEVLAYQTTLNNSKFAKTCTDSKIILATIKGTVDDDYIISGGTRSAFHVTDNQTGKGISSTYSSVYNTSKGYETDDYLSFNPSNRTVTDVNDAPYGIIYIGSGVTNAPESYCLIFTFGVGGYKQQIGFPVSSTPSKFYVRKKSSSGNWIAWRQVSTTT